MAERLHRSHRAGLVVAATVALLGIVAVASAERSGGTEASIGTTSATSTSSSTTSTTTATSTTEAPAPTTAAPVPETTAPPTTVPPPPPAPAPASALCIGDSVMLGAAPPFQNTLWMCGVVDAVQNRHFHEAAGVVAGQRTFWGGLPPTVVIALGTNGYITSGEIDAAMAELVGVTRVVLVTAQLNHTREWQDQVNGEIRAAAARYPGLVTIADWESASWGHPEYFSGDGIHVVSSPAGAQAFAATIAASI